MKKLFTATIAGWLCSGAAFAEPLSQPDKDYVALGLAAVRVITDCPDYEAIPNSILKLSGQIGVDPGASERSSRSCAQLMAKITIGRS